MIIFKDCGKVYISVCLSHVAVPGLADAALLPENAPFFTMPGTQCVVAAAAGNSAALLDAIRYDVFSPLPELSESAIAHDILPLYRMILTDGRGLVTDCRKTATSFVMAEKDRAFFFDLHGTVMEIGDAFAFGNDDKMTAALLIQYKDLPAPERIKRIYGMKSAYYGATAFPVLYTDTESCSLHVMEKEESV